MQRYLIVIEPTATGFSGFSPDLPGCVAAGASREDIERELRAAIAFHIDGLRAGGLPVPAPTSSASYVEVSA